MPRKPQKDRTSIIIAIALHVVLIGGVVFWAYKTGKLEQMRQAVLQYVKGEKKEEKKPEPPQQKQQTAAPKLPPINQGVPQQQSGGTRRAVASDAPEAAGGSSFFQDTRKQVSGPSTEGASGGTVRQTNAPVLKPIVRPPPVKPVFAPPPTSVKQLLAERAKATAQVESIGAEQISRSSARDVGDIVGKISGSTIVEGKFAVIRGLSDRYTSTLLNGAEIPSGDPYRRSVQLDLFPSSMIDRVAISKTYTPDQPGGTGGSTIDVVTKSFPPQPFIKVSAGTSYNPNSNLKKNFLADPQTSMQMYDIPQPPRALDEQYFSLSAAPGVPGPAISRETPERAAARRAQADAQAGLLQSLGTANFAGVSKESPLNSGFNASAGDTLYFLHQPLGLFAGINYSRTFRFIEDMELSRSDRSGFIQKSGREQRSNITTDYGANLNIGYKISPLVEVDFNYLLAHTIDEEARHDYYDFLSSPAGDTLDQWQLHFTEREINNYQFRAKIDMPPVLDSRLDLVLNLANTEQNEPDHRFMNYFRDELGTPRLGDAGLPVPIYPSRYFREITEDALNAKADWTVPFFIQGRESSFKLGIFESTADRNFREQYFGYDRSGGFNVANPNSYLNNPAYLNYQTIYLGGIRTNYDFARIINLAVGRPYKASSEFLAGYLMADVSVLPWLRLIGGARVEHTLMEIDAFNEGFTKLDQVDLLPAASAVVNLSSNVALRLSYAETIARPSFREKSPILNYLPDRNAFARGNGDLQISSINSYDARIEWFPEPGDMFGVGVFYKDLKKPIELFQVQLDGDDITWINRDKAKVMGIEFEARKSLRPLAPRYFEGLTIGVNAALIKSETPLTPVEYQNKSDVDGDGVIDFPTKKTRPLYDQSPYVINLDLTYDHPTSGTSFTVAANLTGERISLATAQGLDQYEHPPVTLDVGISQRIGRNWTVRFGVRNLLDSDYLQTYGSKPDGAIYQKYKRGRTFSISLTAEF